MTAQKPPSAQFVTWAILILLAIIWGSSFILMKRAMFTSDKQPLFSDVQVAALRISMASLVLLPFAFIYVKRYFKKHWLSMLAVGLFGNGLPAFLFTASQNRLDSSYVGILNSLVPLLTLLIGLWVYKTKVSRAQMVGIFLGMGGAVGLVSTQGIGPSGNLAYSWLVVGATLCYAISVNIIRYSLQEVPSVAITAIAFLFIGPLATICVFATDFTTVLTDHPQGWEAFGYTAILAVVGTSFAVILFNWLIKMTSSIFAASVTYFIPLVAILWGVVDGEEVTALALMFSTFILCGVYLVNKKKKER